MSREKEILIDVQEKQPATIVNRDLRDLAPGVSSGFEKIDQSYLDDPKQYLTETVGDIEKIKIHETSQEAVCSFIYDEDTAKASEALVIFAPFSDVEPKSPVDKVLSLLEKSPNAVSIEDLVRTKPHSYNQAVKSKTIHDLLKFHRIGMPVITVFSPMRSRVYSPDERSRFKSGDFSPATKVAEAAITRFEDKLHGPNINHIAKVHFNGLSLGASNARGAATGYLYSSVRQLGSYTGQEMIMGPDHTMPIVGIGKRFAFERQIDRPDERKIHDDGGKILEPRLARELSERGREIQWVGRTALGMTRWTFLEGLTKSKSAKTDLMKLNEAGVKVTLANAFHSGLTKETQRFIRSGHYSPVDLQPILARAIEGEQIGHELNELIVPTASIALAGILHAANRK